MNWFLKLTVNNFVSAKDMPSSIIYDFAAGDSFLGGFVYKW